MPRTTVSLIAALMLLAAAPATAQHGAYAGQQSREIKALSAQETADLLAGRGMGLARAAELNSYPGPMHVLELRGPLDLSAAQLAAVQASFERMQAAARPLGAELVEHERALDGEFRGAAITPGRMAAQTETIGMLQGKLRTVHLAAHLEMRDLLTPDQVARYDALRGYAGGKALPTQAVPGNTGTHRH